MSAIDDDARREVEYSHNAIQLVLENSPTIFFLHDENAVKFSPHGSVVRVRLSASEQVVRVAVSDEGQGLTDDDKQMLFQKFAKLSAKPTGNESSTGIGLFIAKNYIDAMNGRIWCESEFGNGATFIFELPIADESSIQSATLLNVENAT